jgi:hypothetical protein
MKFLLFFVTVSLVSLTACSTPKHHPPRADQPKEDGPESVIVTYHVKPGQEEQLQDTLARAWALYQKEHMVAAQPHILVRDNDVGGRVRFLEIFTWASHAAPKDAPDSVKTIWGQMQSLCEPRDGHPGLDGGEVDLLVPPGKASKPQPAPPKNNQ